ncbi:MAG: hypothetical protein C0424_03820 [Sphingobacteriaceae bacterium]|nr:hypothetical protein [Sphingobacteriaceae bacterium]
MAIACLGTAPAQQTTSHQLWIYVTGVIPSDIAKVNIGLYRSIDNFPKREGTYKHHIVHASNDTIKVKFEVPFGEYAVAATLDVNANNRLDRNSFGYPIEPFGFSRGFRPSMRGPRFSECAFQFVRQNQLIYVRLSD